MTYSIELYSAIAIVERILELQADMGLARVLHKDSWAAMKKNELLSLS